MAPVIRRLGPEDAGTVLAAGHLFDDPADHAATRRFLVSPGHHLLMAFDGDVALGFVTGIEMTHPDKGTEMFLYELGVDPSARRRGIGAALAGHLRDLASDLGCYGMWVLADADNDAALATYRKAGANEPTPHVMLEWHLARRDG